jgi:hypothetical protein
VPAIPRKTVHNSIQKCSHEKCSKRCGDCKKSRELHETQSLHCLLQHHELESVSLSRTSETSDSNAKESDRLLHCTRCNLSKSCTSFGTDEWGVVLQHCMECYTGPPEDDIIATGGLPEFGNGAFGEMDEHLTCENCDRCLHISSFNQNVKQERVFHCIPCMEIMSHQSVYGRTDCVP